MDDSNESPVISPSVAIASLETVCIFLLQQDNAKEYVKLVGKIEKFFRIHFILPCYLCLYLGMM